MADYDGPDRRITHCPNHEQHIEKLAQLQGSTSATRWMIGLISGVAIFIVGAFLNNISSQLYEIKADIKEVKVSAAAAQLDGAITRQQVENIKRRVEVLESLAKNR